MRRSIRSTSIVRTALLGGCLAAVFTGAPVSAATPDALAASSGCAACHAADHRILGPSWHEIAAKYHGDAKAPAALAAKVRAGGKGAWGQVPMPPSDPKKIGDADLATLIAWVLKQ